MALKEETWSNKRLTNEGKQLSRIKYLIFWIRYRRLSQPKHLQSNNSKQGSNKKEQHQVEKTVGL